MQNISELEKRVSKLEERNRRVELNKDWETSNTRKVILVVFTYLAIGLYLVAIKIPNPWLNAIVPSLGFLLSTLTLPFFKTLWESFKDKKSNR